MFLGTFLCIIALAQSQGTITQNKPTILFVGFCHLDDSLLNILSPQRQKEVEEVVTRLRRYQPTKIAVERDVRENDTLDDRYAKYLIGNYDISGKRERFVNTKLETYQIGFRLAKELQHKKIYGVDFRNWVVPSTSMDSFARANNQEIFLSRFKEVNDDEIDKPMNEIIKTSTILRLLQFLNADSTIPIVDRAILCSDLHIGRGENYNGTNQVLRWFERNLKIYTNITRIVDSPNDRILVLIGAAHVNSLRWFALLSGEYTVESIGIYLQ
jgi:hypothetical protein